MADCPFCYEEDLEKNTRKRSPGFPRDQAITLTPTQFRAHVASHMVGLALFAIACSIFWDDESKASGDLSNVALHGPLPANVSDEEQSQVESELLGSENPQEAWRSPILNDQDFGSPDNDFFFIGQ